MGLATQGGSIVVYDLAGSPKITLGRDARSVTRDVHFAWVDVDALIAELFPAAPALPGAYPGVSYLYAESCDISPLNPNAPAVVTTPVATYLHAKATIRYSTLSYDSSTLLERSYSISSEFMRMPNSGLKWLGPPEKDIQQEDVSAAKIIPSVEHSIKLHRQTSVPLATIREKLSHVNSATFEGAAAETYLYMGAQVNFTFSTDGSKVWTVEHRFHERQVKQGDSTYGWNHLYRPETGQWEPYRTKNGDRQYPTTDFAALLA